MKNEPPPETVREGDEVGQEKAANDSGRNRKGRSRKMPESEKWSRTHIANRLMVWTTALVAFATLFYAVATAFQVYLFRENARETAQQTDRLIDTSEKQAAVIREALEETKRSNREVAERAERALNTAEKQANASLTQANVSERMVEQNKELLKSARTQANTSQLSARAAERSAQLAAESQRPSIEIAEIRLTDIAAGKMPTGRINFRNGGASPARNFTVTAVIAFTSEKLLDATIRSSEPSTKATVIVLARGGAPVGVGTTLKRALDPQDITLLEERVGFVYLYVTGSYDDTLTRTHVEFEHCFRYNYAEPASIPFCTTHNTVKESRY